MASLKGDLRFMAERMNVKCAPMPVGTADEYRIFSIFVLHNPKMTDAKFRVLGKEFLAKTDGKTVFPKLPSMLKSHYKQWKKNQVIRQVEREAKQIVDATLEQLQRPQPTPATRNSRLAGRDDVEMVTVPPKTGYLGSLLQANKDTSPLFQKRDRLVRWTMHVSTKDTAARLQVNVAGGNVVNANL
jgi:hypothetical protein